MLRDNLTELHQAASVEIVKKVPPPRSDDVHDVDQEHP
jgi:hypothetical protein